MAREFVRSVKNVKDINTINDNITEENDLISDINVNVYIRKKTGYQLLNVGNDKHVKDVQNLIKKIENVEYDFNGLKIDLNNYSKKSDIPDQVDLSTYAQKSDLTPYTKKIDVLNYQKYKLTNDDGNRLEKSKIDILTLSTGFYEVWECYNTPLDDTGIYNVIVFGKNGRKFILATHSYQNRTFINTIHTNGSIRGWKEITNNQIETRINNIEKDYKQKITSLEERINKLENPTT